jgi:hypothetical protein
VNSGCVWNGACLVAHVSEFATMNYHIERCGSDGEIITIQMVRDVQRLDTAKEGNFRFPLKEDYNEAFNTPEGWLYSWWHVEPTMCRMPAADGTGATPTASDEILRVYMTNHAVPSRSILSPHYNKSFHRRTRPVEFETLLKPSTTLSMRSLP